MIYCFDIDGTICNEDLDHEYEKAVPNKKLVTLINKLYDEGHTIKIATARGGMTGIDHTEMIKRQLSTWGVKYHELHKKVPAHLYIDDRGIHPEQFLKVYNG